MKQALKYSKIILSSCLIALFLTSCYSKSDLDSRPAIPEPPIAREVLEPISESKVFSFEQTGYEDFELVANFKSAATSSDVEMISNNNLYRYNPGNGINLFAIKSKNKYVSLNDSHFSHFTLHFLPKMDLKQNSFYDLISLYDGNFPISRNEINDVDYKENISLDTFNGYKNIGCIKEDGFYKNKDDSLPSFPYSIYTSDYNITSLETTAYDTRGRLFSASIIDGVKKINFNSCTFFYMKKLKNLNSKDEIIPFEIETKLTMDQVIDNNCIRYVTESNFTYTN